MKLRDTLAPLPAGEVDRLLGRIEGMEMAMRICRNRAVDMQDMMDDEDVGTRIGLRFQRDEAETLAAMIRLVQVSIGNGTMPFGDLTAAEQEEIWRIY